MRKTGKTRELMWCVLVDGVVQDWKKTEWEALAVARMWEEADRTAEILVLKTVYQSND